jgi:glutathione synthase/RimK-type ligase-like ATP-grasp enzyme
MTIGAPRVLLATCANVPDGDGDEQELVEACARQGVVAQWAVWDDPDVDWSMADLVVVRSTWDYVEARQEFLRWARGIDRLSNPAEVLAWSSDKVYLHRLAEQGVPVVPTTVVADAEALTVDDGTELVVKPSVGAGSVGAGRFSSDRPDATILARAHAADLQAHGRTVLTQPYLERVDTGGETDIIFIDGVFSHAVRKGAMLPGGTVNAVDGASGDELFRPELIEPRTPDAVELRVAQSALAAVPGPQPLLYVRIDLLPTDDGPVVNEVELVEPSLFLRSAPGSVDRLAEAIARRARTGTDRG